MGKTAIIKASVTPEVKARLKQKASELGLSITSYIEKVSCEPVAFLDSNVKAILSVLNFKPDATSKTIKRTD